MPHTAARANFLALGIKGATRGDMKGMILNQGVSGDKSRFGWGHWSVNCAVTQSAMLPK